MRRCATRSTRRLGARTPSSAPTPAQIRVLRPDGSVKAVYPPESKPRATKKSPATKPAAPAPAAPAPAAPAPASDSDSEEDVVLRTARPSRVTRGAAAASPATGSAAGGDGDSSEGSDAEAGAGSVFDSESDYDAGSADSDSDESLGPVVDEATAQAEGGAAEEPPPSPPPKASPPAGGSKRKRPTPSMTETSAPAPVPSSALTPASGAGLARGTAGAVRQTLESERSGWQCPEGRDSAAVAARHAHLTDKEKRERVFPAGEHFHDTLKWLWEDRRDGAGRPPSHPQYDPRTLTIPPSFLTGKGSGAKKPTEAQRQWWEFKRNNMDTLLFFKMGKFYELFHMDADVLVQELDCIYMKGFSAHAGFPEPAFGRFSEALVARGYRVARVEQTETPDQLAARRAAAVGKKPPNVVRRELVSIKSQGTRLEGHMDVVGRKAAAGGELSASAKNAVAAATGGGGSGWLYALAERPLPEGTPDSGMAPCVRLGVVAAECTSGTLHLAEFDDDRLRTRLRTMMVRCPPAEFIYAPRTCSEATKKFLMYDAPTATASPFPMPKDAAKAALATLHAEHYFDPQDVALTGGRGGGDGSQSGFLPEESVPQDLLSAIAAAEAAGWAEVPPAQPDGRPAQPATLALAALGAMLAHLKRCLIDRAVMAQGKVFTYDPMGVGGRPGTASVATTAQPSQPALPEGGDADPEAAAAAAATALEQEWASAPKLALDAATLVNLEVLANNTTGGGEGSLLAALGTPSTPMGRRLLREWVTKPLAAPGDVLYRLAAVEDLMAPGLSTKREAVAAALRGVPDIAKVAARIHRNSSKALAADHPEARAVMYEGPLYARRKLRDLKTVLGALEAAVAVRDAMAAGDAAPTSDLLKRVTQQALPDVAPLLAKFKALVDVDAAISAGAYAPRPGQDDAYEAARASVREVQGSLDEILASYKDSLNCSKLAWFHQATGNRKYQLEVPEEVAGRVDTSFELISSRKSGKQPVRRYWTPDIKAALKELDAAEAGVEAARQDSMRRLFARFDAHRHVWAAVGTALGHLDALITLARASANAGMCKPNFVRRIQDAEAAAAAEADRPTATLASDAYTLEAALPVSRTPVLELKQGRHPCVEGALRGAFVPNDVTLGGMSTPGSGDDGAPPSTPTCVLLTGPNMGGKSTLLRQTCMAAIMAHLGAYVPGESFTLTPVDRVFTRVGASDRILAGQSTFFVELAETATILNGASPDSLVILDELGRGTATFDGNAIAFAVVQHLTSALTARTMFATHYHALCDEFASNPAVALTHMACYVEQKPDGTADVTFLYQHVPGPCPKSYGMNVARLAHLPEAIIQRAAAKSEQFEIALHTAIASRAAGGGGSALASHWAALPREAKFDEAACMKLYGQAAAMVAAALPEQADGDVQLEAQGAGATCSSEPWAHLPTERVLAGLASHGSDEQLVQLWKAAREEAAKVPAE